MLKGKSQLNSRFLSFTNWTHPWTSKEHRNDFLWDQSRLVFLNSQFLLYALMSFMRSCLWFKFFINWYQSTHRWHLSCNFFFKVFGLIKVFSKSIFGAFFRLMLILHFEEKLMLETCRKHLLEENPEFFLVFWNSIDGISKTKVSYGSSFMRFCANF